MTLLTFPGQFLVWVCSHFCWAYCLGFGQCVCRCAHCVRRWLRPCPRSLPAHRSQRTGILGYPLSLCTPATGRTSFYESFFEGNRCPDLRRRQTLRNTPHMTTRHSPRGFLRPLLTSLLVFACTRDVIIKDNGNVFAQ